MYIPPFISVVWQRAKTDCSVACLAMIAGVSYEQALLAIGQKKVLKSGTDIKSVIAGAKRLGKTLKLHRMIDPETDTGVLGVKSPKWDYDHLVILHGGNIIDPRDQTVWDYETYLAGNECTAVSILTLETKPRFK